MKNKIVSLATSFVLVLLFAIPSHAIFDGDVDKAIEFMKAGMYPQAISLLDKRINEKPTDTEAHFQLGICYIHTGNLGGADARFTSSVKLDSKYGFKIGGEYKAAGEEALNQGNIVRAGTLFKKAIEYQPNLRDGIAKEVMAYGKASMKEQALSLAYSLNPAYGKEISKLFYNKGNASTGKNKINFYRTSKQYNPAFTAEMADHLVSLAKDESTEKNLATEYKKVARDFMSEETWNEAFPPLTWQKVISQEYVGRGMDDSSSNIRTFQFGNELKLGDKIITEGSDFFIFDKKWRKHTDSHEFIIKNAKEGNYFYICAEKGIKVKITIQRLM